MPKAESEISLAEICPLTMPLGFTVISCVGATPQDQQLATCTRVKTHLHTTKQEIQASVDHQNMNKFFLYCHFHFFTK